MNEITKEPLIYSKVGKGYTEFFLDALTINMLIR